MSEYLKSLLFDILNIYFGSEVSEKYNEIINQLLEFRTVNVLRKIE